MGILFKVLFGDTIPVVSILSLMLWLGYRHQREIDALFLTNKWAVFIMQVVVPMAVFIVYGFLLFLLDMTSTASFRASSKIQPSYNPTLADYWKAAKVAAFNWVVLGIPFGILMCLLVVPFREKYPCWRDSTETLIPTAREYFSHIIIFALVEEILFFYCHKWLHTKDLYASVHKFHHQFTAPFGIAAVYALPLEHFLSNMFPLVAGPTLLGSSSFTVCCWISYGVFTTMTHHSGYRFAFLPSAEPHDWHHETFNECFGVLGLLDTWYGTNAKFLAHLDGDKKKST